MKIDKKHLLNYSILIPYLILSILGLIVVYSTTSATLIQAGANPFASVLNQGVFWIASLVAIFILYRMKLSFLRNGKVLAVMILLEILLLILARIFGKETNGARGWLYIGPFSMQPAEYLKVILVWYLAHYFARREEQIGIYDYQALTKNQWIPRKITDWRIVTLLLIGIVIVMPDLGNATILALTTVILVGVSGIAPRWFGAIVAAIVSVSALFLGIIKIVGVETMSRVPVFGYVANRFSAYFNPFADLEGAGHQLANSYYAMSNGGWFGLGLGNSIEKRGYLPEAQTDFVFSIVIEEFGFVGASLILALLFFLILRIILVGMRAKNAFNAIMSFGIGGMLLMQTFINIGGISGLIPSTGVTFPFLSQGGNSVLTLSIAIAFVLNISAGEKKEELYRELEFEEN
ncbi:Cell division protein FtsW [Streptococcus sp. DD10]|uniref:cell division peptidoglycan polymerase FtsW n=1 Tax=Streptococcus sp. DD10 TaxID=1777878 RepID=UPI00079720AB|nr:FtsW/RodA/SpoVE family cell cycle protein [Streptococcus sp. DD10]KXT77099.1 Cell division protein FtsW [Streptococcus sp. DD10]